MKSINFLIFLILFSGSAIAQNYVCGKAEVVIEKLGEYESSRIHVTAKKDERETSLWLHSIDYISGTCITNEKNQSKILINGHCGGSGCSEKTYTIIDARTLMVELVPVQGKNNLSVAESILGKKILE
ncbi:hypothetical protein ORJ04_22375 [Rheinheimera baltica]|uniref:Uncharacterized protein n=1 Tax=Rheinheimera baltica TaxID=67576 RepID=A0ABT9I5L8_9GAMM|nr:hypothetical protein [Rheinheimera baltica]MDP5138698.1 hypothetical protein [Rheinheimera baltica]MDP5151742.1 hypothetical protein [Rheinheimera baltica]